MCVSIRPAGLFVNPSGAASVKPRGRAMQRLTLNTPGNRIRFQLSAGLQRGSEGGRMRAVQRILCVVLVVMCAPALAWAQASITGVIKDASGAVLPGVTVEASSPALIEKVRAAVTDSSGQYRIIDLRPGIYTVTFSLTGFTTVRRADVELTGTFTATVDADLRVGTLEETITVTGESPIVDVQSIRRQTTVSGD